LRSGSDDVLPNAFGTNSTTSPGFVKSCRNGMRSAGSFFQPRISAPAKVTGSSVANVMAICSMRAISVSGICTSMASIQLAS